MGVVSVRGGGAGGLAARTAAPVRLRPSPLERLLWMLRWLLGLAGAVVVLWVGAAFLAASPASAAVVVPVAAQQAMSKGGHTKSAGGNGGSNSGSGSSGGGKSEKQATTKKVESKPDNKPEKKTATKSGDTKTGNAKPGDTKPGAKPAKKPAEKSDSKKVEPKPAKKAGQQAAGKNSGDKKAGSKPVAAKDGQAGSSDAPRSAERAGERKPTSKKAAVKGPAQKKPPRKTAAEEQPVPKAGKGKTAKAAEKPTGTKNRAGRAADAVGRKGAEPAGRRDRAAATAPVDAERAAATRGQAAGTAGQRAGTEPAGAKRVAGDAGRTAAARTAAKGTAGTRDTTLSAADALRAVRTAKGVPEGAAGERNRRGQPAATNLALKGALAEKQARTGARSGEQAASGTRAVDSGDRSISGALRATESLRAACTEAGSRGCAGGAAVRPGVSSAADPRGPPSGEDEYRYSASRFGERQDHDDSEQTERVLEGRIKVDQSKARLAAEKKKVASGEVTKAAYAKDEKKHQQLAKQVAAERAELSPERAELVDEVVDGHRALTAREKQLAAEEKKVAAGTVTKKAHAQNVATYESQRDEVYEATDELMAATGNDVSDSVPSRSRGGEGSAAGCGSSGAFVACGAVSRGADGEKDTDRCVALAGVSSGCGVQTSAGESKGSASCTLTGADQGCGSSTSSRAEDGTVTTASARCTGDATGCGQSSRATPQMAESTCRTGAGACRGESSGPSQEDADAPPTAKREKTASAASCTGRCDLNTYADSGGAEAGCTTAAGVCDSSSSGGATDRPDVQIASSTQVQGEDTRRAGSTARCEAAAVGCGTSSSVAVGDRWSGDGARTRSATRCADGATGCTGRAASTTSATDRAATERTATAATEPAAPEATTTGTAECTVADGGCSAESGSGHGDTAGDRDAGGASTAAVEVDCAGAGAGCTGTGRAATTGTAKGLTAGAERTSNGEATCEAAGGDCRADSGTRVGSTTDEQADVRTASFDDDAPTVTSDGDGFATSTASANVDCGDGPACTGRADTTTAGTVTGAAAAGAKPAVRTTSGSSTCETTAGTCGAESASEVTDTAARTDGLRAAADGAPERELAASSTAGAQADCAIAECRGAAISTTTGAASGDVVGVRDSTATTKCTVHGAGGNCSTAADTTVADRDPAEAAEGVTAVSGPVSVSHASAQVRCDGADGTCGGTAVAGTSARDTAVSPQARGTRATTDCTVTGGGCAGEATSAASSAPDFVVVDPDTGLPVAGQPTSGPSSAASSSASLQCADAGCTGAVTTGTEAWDGAVNGGAPRVSTGSATCDGGTGGCDVRSVSTASTGAGAALALAGDRPQVDATGDPKPVTTSRLIPGPSAASAAGAALTCEGETRCDGKVTSEATATDPAVSPDPRGSRSEGTCEGVAGGICQAVTNSGASSGPDANVIAPLVQARSTANATVSEGTIGPSGESGRSGDQQQDDGQQGGPEGPDQPATLPVPVAPGSSANSGGPTVPGASSWTTASATMDCAGSGNACTGTARTSASGTDGPNSLNGSGGARGPPATGTSSSSGSCTSDQSGCRVQTDSSAGSGQVVADIVAEQQNTAAEQMAAQAEQAEQAAADAAHAGRRAGATDEQKKAAADAAQAAKVARQAATEAADLAAQPVRDAPATLAQSSAVAQCAGTGCAAVTTGGTDGTPGRAHTTAGCVAAESGCVVASDATASSQRDSGRTTGTGDSAKPVAGVSGAGRAASRIVCPEAGCTGSATGTTASVAGPDGRQSRSTATGETRCDATTACQAQISATTATSTTAPDAKAGERFATTSASITAACDDGSTTGCATRASSTTTTVGGPAVRAASNATCAAAGVCQVGTGGNAMAGAAEVTADCTGIACRTRTGGGAQAAAPGGTSKAASSTDCTAGADGRCAGVSRVGAGAGGSQASAACQGGAGSTCRYSFSSTSSASSRTAGNRAAAAALGSGAGGSGAGWCATSAAAQAEANGAVAAAACQGSAGSRCSYSFRARRAAAGAAGGASARALASGSGAGTFGNGYVATSAAVSVRPGSAQASASCTGSPGVRCSHSYSARASASAEYGGNRASAYASGSGGGGRGGGGVAVSAQASAGPGYASAGASCAGAANCRYSYSAAASAAAAYGGNRAYAFASGSGGGGRGGGGVAVSAQASAGPGYAQASASCSGAANCRYSYSATAAASASYDDGTHRSWARASASGSGGGSGPGGGGLSVWAQAQAGKGFANAAAGCSGAANCSASFSSHAEASKTVGGQHGEAWANCSGGGAGGSCGSYATVEVDSEHATAQAGCSGTGACSTHYATRSAASAAGEGISGDARASCSGSRAGGGYCATGARATYNPQTGRMELSSYCGTEGGSCSRYANLNIDAASPNGELTGKGQVRCSGGVGSCGIAGVAKYQPATTDEKGNRVPPMLVIGTGCESEGGGSCTQSARAEAKITSPDGTITGIARSACAGTTGWCSTVVGGGFDAATGRIDAYSDCADGGAGTCTTSQAHLEGRVSGPGQAVPNGPTDGTVSGDGRSDCAKRSGVCSVSGVFAYVPAQVRLDDNGNVVKDENGTPVVVPARVDVQTGCYPAGPQCSQDAHVRADVAQQSKDEKHTGTARADCAGAGGTCALVGSAAYNAETGRVEAFTDCAGLDGGTCTRSETHTEAWAQAPDGKLTGTGRSDCVQPGGSGTCSSVSVAKYQAEYTKYPPKCTSPHGCFQAPPTTVPEQVAAGAGCEASGADGGAAACSYSFSATGDRQATGDDGRLSGEARGGCSDSGSAGSGACSVAASVKVDADKHTVDVVAWCEGSDGVSCSYSGKASADHESGRNTAASDKGCGRAGTGSCSLSVSAFASGGDDERQGQAVASGFCADSNSTCSGEFRTHVDSNRDTLSDCHSSGNGLCFGFATPKSARSGGEIEDGGELFLHSKAPGREESRQCSSGSSCGGEAWVEEMGGKYVVLDVETKKSVGGFFKNLARDGGSVVVHAVPGLVDAVGTEVGSWVTANEWGDGLAGYAENRPFTGGIAQSAVNFYDRWLNDGGSWERIGDDYYFTPVSTLLEDVGTVALVAAGAGVAVKLVSMGAKSAGVAAAGATATSGLRGALTSVGRAAGRAAPGLDAVATATLRLANVTGNVALAPYRPYFWAGRTAAGVGARVLAPASRAAFTGSAALAERGAAALQNGRLAAGTGHAGGAVVLGRVGSALETSAYAGRIIQRGGVTGRTVFTGTLLQRLTAARPERIPGLFGTARAHHVLGLPFGRSVSPKELGAARQAASLQAWGTDLPTSPGRLTPLGYLRGHEAANAIRQKRVAKAHDVLLTVPALRAGTAGGGPALLSGADVTPAQRAGSGGGAQLKASGGNAPLPGQPGTNGGLRPHLDEMASVPARDGHPARSRPAAGELDLPPPGTRYTVETSGGSRVTVEIVARPERSNARVETVQQRITEVESELRAARTAQGEAVHRDIATNRQLRAEQVRLRAELDRLRQPTDPRLPGATDVPGLHHREAGPPVEVAPGVTVQRVEVTPQRAASRAQRVAAVEARLAEIQAGMGDRSASVAAGARADALETQLTGLRHRLVEERAGLDGRGVIDLGLPGVRLLRDAASDGPRPSTREAPAEAGAGLPAAPADAVRSSRWQNLKAGAKEILVKVGLTGALVIYSVIPHPHVSTAHVPQLTAHVAEAGAAARSVPDGSWGPVRGHNPALAPRTSAETGPPVGGTHTSPMRQTVAADGATGARPVAGAVPHTGAAAAGARTVPALGPGTPPTHPETGRQPPAPTLPDAPTVGGGPIPVWDRRLQDIDGKLHLRVSGRTRSIAEALRPAHITDAEWAGYSPAQRAEAWYAARDVAHHEDFDAAITEINSLQRALDQAIGALERKTAVVRAKAGLPVGPRATPDRGRRPEVSWQREAERAVAELAGMRGQRAILDERRAALVEQRAAPSWTTAQSARPGTGASPERQEFASIAQGYGDMHRKIAESSRSGRRQLAQVERYRAEGITSVQVRDAVWAQRLGRRLVSRAPAEVAGDLRRFVAAGDRAALVTLMSAGLAGDLGDRVLARFAERHGLPWNRATRAGVLAVLPTTMNAAWRATSPPRNAAWPDTVRRDRIVVTWGAGTTALTLLGGGLAVLGGSGSAALVAAGFGITAISAALRRLAPDTLRIRGPPARARMLAAAGVAASSTAVLTGISAAAREPLIAAGRRRAAARELRSVMAGLDGPVVTARSRLAAARGGVAAADAELADVQRRGAGWLFSGPDAMLSDPPAAAARDVVVAGALGIDPAEVRLFAGLGTAAPAPAGAVAGLGEPTGSFQERQERLSAHLAAAEARLRDATAQVGLTTGELADRQVERRATLEAAVRAAARGGLPAARIAAITDLNVGQVRQILGNPPGGGSGPAASGGGSVPGGGASKPTGDGPEQRPSLPPRTNGVTESRALGSRKAGPQPRSRGPPWWQRFSSNQRAAWSVVLLTGGLLASLAAVRYGVADPGVLAAGMVWWPGQRRAAKELREKVAEANEPLTRALEAEALLREAVRGYEQGLGERLGWVPALAERLHDLGRTDDQIAEGLAAALGVNPQRVRARLADPALGGSVTLPTTLADPGLSADALLGAARAAVALRSTALGQAVVPLSAATRQVVAARTQRDQQVREAAVTARTAGVRAGPVSRVTGLSTTDVRGLPATPPTVRTAAGAVQRWLLDRWQTVRGAAGTARQWAADRWRAARDAVSAARQWVLDRWRAASVLRGQVRAVARLRAAAGSAARLMHREQRAAARQVTPEQLGWVGWLSVVAAGAPAAARLSEYQLVQRIGEALGLREHTARRLVARAGRLDPARSVPPAGTPAADVAFGPAVAVVGEAFATAFPGLARSVAAHRAAGQALVAGRAEAARIAADAGVASARAGGRLDRAARGRGLSGYRLRLTARPGVDVPVAERNRRRVARVAGFGIGVGAGLWGGAQLGIAGSGLVTGPLGLVVAAAGLVVAARAVWTPRQTRGPPWEAVARGLRTQGVRIGISLAVGLAAGMAGPTVWALLQQGFTAVWPFLTRPGLRGLKALLVPLVAAGLIYRYVLRRQYANQDSGMQTRPRRAAALSAGLAYVIAAGLGLLRVFAPATLPWWVVPVAVAIGAGIAGAAVQQKELGRTKRIKSVVSGALSAAVAFVISGLAGGAAPGAVRDLVSAVAVAVIVYASPTVIAEYVNVWAGRIMAPIAKRKAKQAQKNAAESSATGSGDRQRRWLIAWLDYTSFSPVDTRLLFRKAVDPVLAGLAAIAINLSWVSRPWVEANDSLTALLVRFGAVAGSVWLIGKLVRDPDEHRAGYYGYRSSRALRSPDRPFRWLWIGDRLHRRVAGYRTDLEELLGHFGLVGPLNEQLAGQLADRLWARMSAEIPGPLDEWESLPATPEIRQALDRERAAAAHRRTHHVETITSAVPVLAADPDALARVATHLRDAGRTADADVVEFQRLLGLALWARAGPQPRHAASSRTWTERLATAVKDRNTLRAEYLGGPRRALLAEIKQYYLDNDQPDHPNLRRARAALRALEFELEGMSRPRSEPLEAIAQLAGQRARSATDAATTEERALAARQSGATPERLAEQRQLTAGMRLLRSAALLGSEVELSDTQRRWNQRRWTDALAAAARTAPRATPATLLERLLVIAGRKGPVTPEQLAAQYGGPGWDTALAALADLGALTGDAVGGYRADPKLAAVWRAAGPRLRHAVRADPLVLPGGAELAPLTAGRLGATGVTQAEKDAYTVLREVLRDGELAFRHWRDGWVDDAGIGWRRLTGLAYQLRNPAGRYTWPLPADHPAAPVRFATGARDLFVARWRHAVVPTVERRRLLVLLQANDRADRLYHRALRMSELLVAQRVDGRLPDEAIAFLDAARGAQVEAHTALGEARENAIARLTDVGAYPHQIDRTLRAAEAARPYAPGADPLPPTAEHWLREIAKELDGFRVQLDRLPGGPERGRALGRARLALARYDIDRDYAWQTKLYRTAGGWKVMETARIAAKNLRGRHPDLFQPIVLPAPGFSPVIPHHDRLEHPFGDEVREGRALAADTRRGRGNPTNQDAATLVALPNGDRVAAVVDGVLSYPNSRHAANRFARAFHDEITRSGGLGRTPEQALRAAHAAGAEALRDLYTPATGHGAVAYVGAYYGTDGTITVIHVGTARAYYLPADGNLAGRQLTTDDSRPGAITDGGTMTRWVAGDFRPEPTVTPYRPTAEGLLVLATDGLWRYLPAPRDLVGKLDGAYTDASTAVTRLANAAGGAGGVDDLTVAALPSTPAASTSTRGPPAGGGTTR
ncbi:hypothetical protein [Pseudonocardia xinjiangensis]